MMIDMNCQDLVMVALAFGMLIGVVIGLVVAHWEFGMKNKKVGGGSDG